jgi:hypothetical protein
MATQRAKLTYVRYMTMPPSQRPAMSAVDALALYQEMLEMKVEIPEEVRTAASIQANEGVPDGWVVVLEEYQGRVRVVAGRK